jgi:hypothetical protein
MRFTTSVATAAVICMSAAAAAAVALGGCGATSGQGGRYRSGLEGFNTCINGDHSLALMRHRPGSRVIVTIMDRQHGTIVGEVATGRTTTLGGAAAINGRYEMSTATPTGHDASAIERCWDRFFPIA